ncbi:MAG TPA: S41 family peptidase [Candidatus Paceibacterota bacterium]
MKRITIAACVLAFASAPAFCEPSMRERLVEQYRSIAYLSTQELERCSQVLSESLSQNGADDSLSTGAVILANEAMKKSRCLDKWSTLVDDRGPDTDATRVYAEVVEDRLFIRFNRFVDAERLIHSAIRQIDSTHLAKVKRIALDLRGNVGGSVDDLAGVLDRFFASRAGIEYLRIRATDYPDKHVTSQRGDFADLPVDILADEMTASAAEWMIAELHGWYPERTRVLGRQTNGKAVIQCRRPGVLTIKVTCGRWDTDERPVQGIGIVPDAKLDFTRCGDDNRCLHSMLN